MYIHNHMINTDNVDKIGKYILIPSFYPHYQNDNGNGGYENPPHF